MGPRGPVRHPLAALQRRCNDTRGGQAGNPGETSAPGDGLIGGSPAHGAGFGTTRERAREDSNL